MELICKRIDFFEKQLKLLYKNKPLYLSKKRKNDYNEKVKYYENKIDSLYKRLEEELSIIENIK